MSCHPSTADMVNNELNPLLQMQYPSIETIMAEMNPNPDFSEAQDIHCSLETNTEISYRSGHAEDALELEKRL